MSVETSFDHVDLKNVDPNFTPVPMGEYTLQVVKAERKEFVYKKANPVSGTKPGDTGNYISMSFAITDDDNFSGRRIFSTLFSGEGTFRNLRRLMDATGVIQEDGEGLIEWVERLGAANAVFKATVEVIQEKDATGELVPKNAVSWKTLAPVS